MKILNVITIALGLLSSILSMKQADMNRATMKSELKKEILAEIIKSD